MTTKFGKAFQEARKSGKSEFTFGGKKYTTKTKEETAAPTPVAKSPRMKALTGKRTPATLRPNDKTHDYYINSDGAGMRKKPNKKYVGSLKKR